MEQTVAEGTNKYGKANSNYPVLETFEEGSVIETKVVMSTWHYVSDLIGLQYHVVAVEGFRSLQQHKFDDVASVCAADPNQNLNSPMV